MSLVQACISLVCVTNRASEKYPFHPWARPIIHVVHILATSDAPPLALFVATSIFLHPCEVDPVQAPCAVTYPTSRVRLERHPSLEIGRFEN